VRQPVKNEAGGSSRKKRRPSRRAVKDSKLKVQASIQGDQLRVTSKSKDELQATMNFLRGQDYGLPLQVHQLPLMILHTYSTAAPAETRGPPRSAMSSAPRMARC